MSKYTTEVRFICESKAGMLESEGYNSVEVILDKSWNKIFDLNIPFFNEEYRPILCKKILRHFYTREIGFETVGLWMLKLNQKLFEIMPFYNQLYNSEKIKFDPFNDVDVTRTSRRDSSGHDESNTVSRDLYSDTPQGALIGVEEEKYLTDARKVLNEGTTDQTAGESYTERLTGKQGGLDYNTLLLKHRETFLNIDLQVIEELNDLFLNLW